MSGVGGDQLHVVVADVVKSFDTSDRAILDCAPGRLGRLLGFGRFTLRIIVRSVSGLSWPRAWGSRGVVMAVYLRAVRLAWFSLLLYMFPGAGTWKACLI